MHHIYSHSPGLEEIRQFHDHYLISLTVPGPNLLFQLTLLIGKSVLFHQRATEIYIICKNIMKGNCSIATISELLGNHYEVFVVTQYLHWDNNSKHFIRTFYVFVKRRISGRLKFGLSFDLKCLEHQKLL